MWQPQLQFPTKAAYRAAVRKDSTLIALTRAEAQANLWLPLRADLRRLCRGGLLDGVKIDGRLMVTERSVVAHRKRRQAQVRKLLPLLAHAGRRFQRVDRAEAMRRIGLNPHSHDDRQEMLGILCHVSEEGMVRYGALLSLVCQGHTARGWRADASAWYVEGLGERPTDREIAQTAQGRCENLFVNMAIFFGDYDPDTNRWRTKALARRRGFGDGPGAA